MSITLIESKYDKQWPTLFEDCPSMLSKALTHKRLSTDFDYQMAFLMFVE